MPAKKNTRRSFGPRSERSEPRPDQELIDDQEFQRKLEAKQRFLGLLRERFNSAVGYNGRAFKWDTVIDQKTDELSRFLIGKSRLLDFSEPSPILDRYDNAETRNRILSLSQESARKIGIGKSTLHHLRRNARDDRSFAVYSKIGKKIERANHTIEIRGS